MHLEKLEIRGFKSFKEKTVLEFPTTFTAIVGPNGSGKSNIIDSVCFVLGSSKGLRASRLEELICNGGTGGEPSQSARVSMYLKGTKGRKKISREISKEGKSEYSIDEKTVTREEVLELVGDNEYNILHQNDVTKLIDMKPMERRGIIDELCGIAEYDKKKEKAMKELEKVESKLAETRIVLGEKQGYLEGLKKERDEAVSYKDLSEKMKAAKGSILFYKLQDEEKKEKELEDKINELQKEKDELTLKTKKIRDEIAEKTKAVKDLSTQLIQLEEKRGDVRLSEMRETYVRSEDRLQNLNVNLVSLKEEISKKKEKNEQLKKEQNVLQTEIDKIQKQLAERKPGMDAIEKNIQGANFENEIDKLKSRVLELNSELKFLEDTREKNLGRIEEIEKEREEDTQRIQEIKKEKESFITGSAKLSKEEKLQLKELEEKKKLLEKNFKEEKENESLLNELMIKIAERRTELKTLRASPNVNAVANAILKIKPVVKGIYGTVAELGSCTNAKYEKALMVASGQKSYAVVVENDDVAKKCIDYLRKNKIGRATFLPLNVLNVNVGRTVPKGAIGFARDFIKTESKFKKIFDWVFFDTLIVEDVDSAKKIGIGKERMVSLEGDLISREGAISGGFLKVSGVFSTDDETEKEIKELERKILSLTEKKEDFRIEREKLVKRNQELEKILQERKTKDDRSSLMQNVLDEKMQEVEKKFSSYEQQIFALKGEIKNSEKKKIELESEIKTKSKELEKLSSSDSLTKFEKLQEMKDEYHKTSMSKNALEEKFKFISQQIHEIKEETLVLTKKEKESALEIEKIQKEVSEIKSKIDEIEKRESGLNSKIEELMTGRGKLELEMTSLGGEIGRIEHSLEEINDKLNRRMITKAKLETSILDLKREFKEFEGITPLEKKISELEEIAEKVGRELAGFGFINMRAIENYELIKKELDEINEKMFVLQNERGSILDFMSTVEKKKKEVFNKTFDIIQKNFEEIYKELTGGKGTIGLDSMTDLSQSGLVIKASPKGKKLINLDMMSGGEKVLTCSAFLLAIQRYKPSHFYILDELDAALDKENSLKLAEMLKASEAQFILITHNDSVLKHADAVIGVSMQDGLSQIVGVKLT